ncbi:hypothetical protein CC78DRAFT_551972 [Lojkania enalia]|uniref:DUF7924 domain-containing protein n=1 Tax=Lojkania enalia TaxID=147567 RepID=A0A9P4N6C0_9PLEO|nr:hypothetical protein CC78DRAFT_551972 [Didymosphaeria enalia]
MAHTRAKVAAKQGRRQQSVRKDQGKRPQGVSRARAENPSRRSARLSAALSEHAEQLHALPSIETTHKEVTAAQPRTRKRSRERECPLEDSTRKPSPKRQRTSPGGVASTHLINPIVYWQQKQTWPKEYFEPEDTMSHLLARRKSAPSLRRKRSEQSVTASSTTPSDQKSRGEKSAPYRDPRYKALLATKGSFMDDSDLDIADESKDTSYSLLNTDQTVPKDSLFRDDIFKRTIRKVEDRNEARVLRDITPLIVPSAEILATYGARELECLIESTNEGWNNSMPLTGTRPQPDYSVGFRREAFTDGQLNKLSPFIGDWISGDQSFFMATYYMYFPFLTCEVKCGAAALDIADRQNAHSMTLAVRAIVELFRLVKLEKELHRNILAFSISHDHRTVRIYGHYPVIEGKDTTYYRHPIHTFDFTALDGKDKWTAYKFTKNVYDLWMPAHLDRIRSVIDELPADFDFDVPPLPDESGLSQGLESHHLRSFTEPESVAGVSQSALDAGDITPDTSFTDKGASKRPRTNTGVEPSV